MKQDVLKKHIGAIQINGRLSLLQRKVFNVLLLHAYPSLPDQNEFTISTGELARLAGFDSNNTEKLKSSFRALARTTVEWNILEGEIDEQWTTSALLADATVHRNRGLCAYSYSHRLKDKLYHPDIYAQINLTIQRQFKSAHALVLYENCARFRNVKSTGWIDLVDWRKLFGIKDGQYNEFKAFSRRVIKAAVSEVNEYSDIHVTPEYKKQQGRVVAIKFTLKPNSTNNGKRSLPDNLDIYQKLIQTGIKSDQVKSILKTYKPAHIEQGLAYLNKMLSQGTVIRSPGAYLKKAIENNYGASHKSAVASSSAAPMHLSHQVFDNTPNKAADLLKTLEDHHSQHCLSMIADHLEKLDEDTVNEIEAAFKAELDTLASSWFQKSGWKSSLLYMKILRFWENEQGLKFPSLGQIAEAHGIDYPPIQ